MTPWHVAESSGCSAGSPWAVIKDADGAIEGCHKTKTDAMAQMAALYASEGGMMNETVAPAELRYALSHFEDIHIRDPHTRENGSDNVYLDGYAAVFNQQTTLYDGQFDVVREVIDPGAFDNVLSANPDVHLLIGHNLDLPMARTGVNLELGADTHGLHVRAKLNPKITYVADLVENMRDGVVDQMSFAFTVPQDGSEYTDTELSDGRVETLRRITRIGELYDVTVTPQGAYSQTSAAIRSLGGLARRAAGDIATITPMEGPAAQVTHIGGSALLKRQHSLAELRRRSSRLTPRSPSG